MNATNWNDLGITWTSSDVQRQHGDNATDRVVIGQAQIPVLSDVDKAVAGGLLGAIMKGVNGTSWRVMAQDVCRKAIEKDRKASPDAMREAVFNRLRSMRASSGPVVIVKRALPNGTMWEGDNEQEFRSEYAAALTDMGVDAAAAIEAAKAYKW